MEIKFLDIGDLKKEAVSFTDIDKIPRLKNVFQLPKSFPETSLFALLLSCFGPPNGLMSQAIKNTGDPNAPWKWDYFLKTPSGSIFAIERSWLNIEVKVFEGKIEKKEFMIFLGNNIQKYENKINQYLKSFETYYLIINPYIRHKNFLAFSEKKLKEMHVKKPFYPDTIVVTKEEMDRHKSELENYINLSLEQNYYCSNVVVESAFMVESYINLLIAILHKKEYEDDLNKNLLMKWKDKIEIICDICYYFKHKIDLNNLIVKQADKLFSLRNKIVHSYPDKDHLCIEKMWYFMNYPLLPRAEPYCEYQIGITNILPNKEEALNAKKISEELINYIESNLEDKVIDKIKMMTDSNPLGWNDTHHCFSKPFGLMVESFAFKNS